MHLFNPQSVHNSSFCHSFYLKQYTSAIISALNPYTLIRKHFRWDTHCFLEKKKIPKYTFPLCCDSSELRFSMAVSPTVIIHKIFFSLKITERITCSGYVLAYSFIYSFSHSFTYSVAQPIIQ